MTKHRMDLENQVDQSRKVKKLEAENSRLRQVIMDVRVLTTYDYIAAYDLMDDLKIAIGDE